MVTIAKHCRTSSSCTLRWCHCRGSLRRFLEGLIDHVVAIGWWLLTLHNTFDRVIVVFQCRSHFLSRTGMETEVIVTVGFCLGLALAMGFPEAMSSYFVVSIDSVTFLSTPFTILPKKRYCLETEMEFELRYCIDHHDSKLLCSRLGRSS